MLASAVRLNCCEGVEARRATAAGGGRFVRQTGPEHPGKSADQRATGGRAACKVAGVLRTDFADVLVAGGVGPAFMWGRRPRDVGST